MLLLNIEADHASSQVKVATIGVATPIMNQRVGTQEMVKQMITFWDSQLKQVLSDNPDIILFKFRK